MRGSNPHQQILFSPHPLSKYCASEATPASIVPGECGECWGGAPIGISRGPLGWRVVRLEEREDERGRLIEGR